MAQKGKGQPEQPTTWTVVNYRTDAGAAPIRTFLDGLTGDEPKQAAALIGMLARQGNALRFPHSKHLGTGLWEMRRHQVRIFYTFRPGGRIVLLDGMVKKKDDIPPAMMARLRRYLRDLETTEGRGGAR